MMLLFSDLVADLIQWFGGMVLGVLFSAALFNLGFRNIKIDSLLDTGQMVKVETKRKKWLIINPRDFCQMLEALCVYIFWRLGKRGEPIDYQKDNRIRVIKYSWNTFVLVVLIAGIIVTFFTHTHDDAVYFHSPWID